MHLLLLVLLQIQEVLSQTKRTVLGMNISGHENMTMM
jgi:hypothetical protein